MIKLPIFKTERLIIREINENDALDMFEYSCSQKKVAAYHKDKVLKNSFTALANDINQNIKTKLRESFNF
jgi:RimJ/RimL family protein N-acetyltransferase